MEFWAAMKMIELRSSLIFVESGCDAAIKER